MAGLVVMVVVVLAVLLVVAVAGLVVLVLVIGGAGGAGTSAGASEGCLNLEYAHARKDCAGLQLRCRLAMLWYHHWLAAGRTELGLHLQDLCQSCGYDFQVNSSFVLHWRGLLGKENGQYKDPDALDTWGGTEGRPALRNGQGGIGKGQIMKRAFPARH